MEKSTILLLLLFVAFVCRPSYGYIDPGSGHFLLQALAIFFLGGLFYVKKVFQFIRSLFTGKQQQKSSTPLES